MEDTIKNLEQENKRLKIEESLLRDAYFQLERIKEKFAETETRYSLLFNVVTDMIFVKEFNEYDFSGKFLEVNFAACRRLGYTLTELLKLPPSSIVISDIDSDKTIIERILKGEEGVMLEQTLISKDGSKISVETYPKIFSWHDKTDIIFVSREINKDK